MICASMNDNLEVLKYLVDNGGDINQSDHMGNTPLLYSLFKDSFLCFNYLVDISNLKQKNINHESILFQAVELGSEEAVEVLL